MHTLTNNLYVCMSACVYVSESVPVRRGAVADGRLGLASDRCFSVCYVFVYVCMYVCMICLL